MRPDEWIADDDRLLEELRGALREAGPVPDDIVTAAKAVYTMRTLDEELARLSYDSMADPELAGTFRAEPMSVRSLVFGIGDTTLDVDVLADTFVGQLSPAVPGSIIVETRFYPPRRAEIDPMGMFSIPLCPPGDVRFRVEPTEGDVFVTEWTRI
jgi:hypothetical protein